MAINAKATYQPSAKTVELIIYISSKMKDKPKYGSTFLGKALYLIDSMSFLKTGQPITDFAYIKQDKGPTPDPAKFLSVRDSLVNKGDLEKINTPYFGKIQYKYIAKREPVIDKFNKEEIFLIDDVLESICEQNATELSDYTHQFISWIFAQNKEELPLYTFLLSTNELDLKDYEWAKKKIKAYESSNKKAS